MKIALSSCRTPADTATHCNTLQHTATQYEWDVLDFEEPDEDRTEFVQNAKTYKRLNRVSHKEEYYP